MQQLNVFEGEREEWRRILLHGAEEWVKVEGDVVVLSDGRRVNEDEVQCLPPCTPSTIICVHLNYDSRRIEFGVEKPHTPTYFQKPLRSLNNHKGRVYRPADCQYLNYEGEIAAIVGRPMRNVARADTWKYLAGFAPANDVGCHDYRDTDAGSMLRVKGMDGFCPIGPGIVRGVDVRESTVRTFLNGELVQDGRAQDMLFGIDYQLADLCRHMTLMPGDILLTGTPAHSRPMIPGDTVEVEVSGIGRLMNSVTERLPPKERIGHQPTASDGVVRVALGSDFPRNDEREK